METQDSHLLVVDDNQNNRDIISRQLKRRGYQVSVAEDGESGLALVESEPIDLVILDIMMPGIGGIETLRRLRAKYSPAQLPIIMATARTDSEDIVECAELGANDHVGKPLDFAILLAKVKALLRLKAVAEPARPADDEPALSDLQPGRIVAGKYRLEERIGAGAFGAVYKARQMELDHDIAIKILQPGVTSNDQSLERFRREGVAACKVRHPNAVQIFDYGVTSAEVAFLAMELLRGEPLSQELRRGPISPYRVNQILQPIGDVLAEAHSKDLVHRDVKPENVFLHQERGEEVIKVLDFGTAKLMGEAAIQENLTAEGWILGTFAYVAPERLLNQGYDGRSDVYSLGVMLFEMLTGEKPFASKDGDPMSVMAQHVHEKPRTLRSVAPQLPVELEKPVARSLLKDPKQRPDAATLARDFARSLKASGLDQPPSAASQTVSMDDETVVLQAETLAIDGRQGKPQTGGGLGSWIRRLTKPKS
ncbi:MAG: protein kinase [Acidobacteriota bacterium]